MSGKSRIVVTTGLIIIFSLVLWGYYYDLTQAADLDRLAKIALKELVTAQESHYAKFGKYSNDIIELIKLQPTLAAYIEQNILFDITIWNKDRYEVHARHKSNAKVWIFEQSPFNFGILNEPAILETSTYQPTVRNIYKSIYAVISVGSPEKEAAERKILFSKALLFSQYLQTHFKMKKENLYIVDDLMKGLDDLASTPDDLVIIYMVGHGGKGVVNGIPLYAFFDGKDKQIDHNQFNNKLNELKAKDMVLVMDFCYSGGFIPKNAAETNRWYFCSVSENETTLYNKKYSGVREDFSLYFTRGFVDELVKSASWNDAFAKSKAKIEKDWQVQLPATLANVLSRSGFSGMHPRQSREDVSLVLPIMINEKFDLNKVIQPNERYLRHLTQSNFILLATTKKGYDTGMQLWFDVPFLYVINTSSSQIHDVYVHVDKKQGYLRWSGLHNEIKLLKVSESQIEFDHDAQGGYGGCLIWRGKWSSEKQFYIVNQFPDAPCDRK
ncbi:MAG: C13 family peptidase [Thermodesulfobacteriota bacterium]